jgi:hypothetical protein
MDILKCTFNEFRELRQLYNYAAKQGKTSFVFKGNTFVTGYAKYVIEYLDSRFKGPGKISQPHERK